MKTYFCVFLLLFSVALPASAIVESQDIMPEEFQSDAEKQRFKELIKDLRCTVCQNQNLADSNASLAIDLRRQVLEQIQAEKTDTEIIEYLVARYGDFVLYKPPFKSTTAVLWVGPFVLFVVAVFALILLIRKRNQQPASPLTSEEAAQLNRALKKAAHDAQSDVKAAD